MRNEMKPELKPINRNIFFKESKIEWGYVIAFVLIGYLFGHVLMYLFR